MISIDIGKFWMFVFYFGLFIKVFSDVYMMFILFFFILMLFCGYEFNGKRKSYGI